jgi:hypothetical protein
MVASAYGAGMLQVQDNSARSVKDLSGIWRFKVRSRSLSSVALSLRFRSFPLSPPCPQQDEHNVGMTERWWLKPLRTPLLTMPVPASYNDITQGTRLASVAPGKTSV